MPKTVIWLVWCLTCAFERDFANTKTFTVKFATGLASPPHFVYNAGMSAKPRKLRVETVTRKYKNKVYTSVLLRRSYRKNGKVCHETVGNLTDLPPDVIDFIKLRLDGELDEGAPQSPFEIARSLPHGHVLAVLETVKRLELEIMLASRRCRNVFS